MRVTALSYHCGGQRRNTRETDFIIVIFPRKLYNILYRKAICVPNLSLCAAEEDRGHEIFEAVPDELFSPLASLNRCAVRGCARCAVHGVPRKAEAARGHAVFHAAEPSRAAAGQKLPSRGEDIDEDELRDISGRARFLIRKLGSKGWFEKERGTDFREYITVPGCSSRLLELFHALREDTPARGYSYVFGTYSTLKVAHESDNVYDKMAAVYGAYDNTRALINLLQMVYHNVKHYFQMQIDMQ